MAYIFGPGIDWDRTTRCSVQDLYLNFHVYNLFKDLKGSKLHMFKFDGNTTNSSRRGLLTLLNTKDVVT